MAILWADGFDDYTSFTGEYETIVGGGSLSILPSSGRRSGGCFDAINNGSWVIKALPNVTELFASFAYRPEAAGNAGGCALVAWYNGGSPVCTLRYEQGALSFRTGAYSGTLIGSVLNNCCPIGIYTHIQVRVVIATSGGVGQLRLNGKSTNDLDVSGNTGSACNGFMIGGGVSGSYDGYIDDLVLADTTGTVANSWLGDVRVDSYRPNGNGDLSQMTGSDGNSVDNYALVNPAAPNGTTYAQSATVNAEDLYQFADVSHAPIAILGVLSTASAKKDDAGARSLRLRAKSGSSTAESAADIVLSTSRTRIATIFEKDPSTGAAWTKAGLNAAQFGFKVSA